MRYVTPLFSALLMCALYERASLSCGDLLCREMYMRWSFMGVKLCLLSVPYAKRESSMFCISI